MACITVHITFIDKGLELLFGKVQLTIQEQTLGGDKITELTHVLYDTWVKEFPLFLCSSDPRDAGCESILSIQTIQVCIQRYYF